MPDNPDAATVPDDTDAPSGGGNPPPDGPSGVQNRTPDTDSPETFPRAYVEDLRREAARHRARAADVDGWAHALHAERVKALSRLQDPTDLPFDEDHLRDPDKLAAAVEDLLARKPHLAARRVSGSVGQGLQESPGGVTLAELLRGAV